MPRLGLVSGTVKIEEYNSEWKRDFRIEKILLKEHLRGYNVDIQHVGSTSIEGCWAKPIIDIAIGVESLEYGGELIPMLCNIGYIYRGNAGLPGRHFFKRNEGELSTHYIHIVPIGGRLWNNLILFRDYLNTHHQFIVEYSKLKRALEKDCLKNRQEYTMKKSPFIESILKRAEDENHILD
ncbi:MAG: GrpB family protein [Clostridiales bacterium]|nr:GrpB family protein [Clostridiales bacterium]